MIHSLILSDRRNNQYKTLGILIFIIYPILSFPFILKGILKRERWAYLLGAILMGYIGMLYPPAGDMYRYAEDFNLYKELDWEYFWIFMALKFDYFLPLLSWILGKLGAYPESTRFLFVACSYYLLLDLYHDITLSNKDMTRRTRVYSLILLVPLTFSIYLFRMGFAQVVLVYGRYCPACAAKHNKGQNVGVFNSEAGEVPKHKRDASGKMHTLDVMEKTRNKK